MSVQLYTFGKCSDQQEPEMFRTMVIFTIASMYLQCVPTVRCAHHFVYTKNGGNSGYRYKTEKIVPPMARKRILYDNYHLQAETRLTIYTDRRYFPNSPPVRRQVSHPVIEPLAINGWKIYRDIPGKVNRNTFTCWDILTDDEFAKETRRLNPNVHKDPEKIVSTYSKSCQTEMDPKLIYRTNSKKIIYPIGSEAAPKVSMEIMGDIRRIFDDSKENVPDGSCRGCSIL
eukprot:395470_1